MTHVLSKSLYNRRLLRGCLLPAAGTREQKRARPRCSSNKGGPQETPTAKGLMYETHSNVTQVGVKADFTTTGLGRPLVYRALR